MFIFTSDGSSKLPSSSNACVSVSFDCSALSHLTNPGEYADLLESRNVLNWLRSFPSNRLELIAGPAVVEAFYSNPRVCLEHLRLYQTLRLDQLMEREHEVTDVNLHMQSVALTLVHVVEYAMCVIAMRDAYDQFGESTDTPVAKRRLLHFLDWAEKSPSLSANTLVGAAMHEALTYNVEARTAFKLLRPKPEMADILNAAWDLYQLDFMLSCESGFIGRRTPAYTVYLTKDRRLSTVFENFGIVDIKSRLVGVTPTKLQHCKQLGPISKEALNRIPDRPEFASFKRLARELARIFEGHASAMTDSGLKNLSVRLREASDFIQRHDRYLLPLRP